MPDRVSTLCCRSETSFSSALPCWPGVLLREKGLKSASGDSTGARHCRLGVEGRQREVLVLPPPLHQGFSQCGETHNVAKPVPLPPLSRETGSISRDYTQHLKENIYRIYIHIPFSLFSGGSPCPPSLPAALTPSPPRLLPLAFPPCCHNALLCERNNVCCPRGWGDCP